MRMLRRGCLPSALELSLFLLELSLDSGRVAMVVLAVLDRDDIVMMGLGQYFTIFDRLD